MMISHQPHGPAANATQRAFKRYIGAQQARGDVILEARAEAHAKTPDALPAVPSASVEDVCMRIRWISSGGAEQRAVEELGALLEREDGFVWVDIPAVDHA